MHLLEPVDIKDRTIGRRCFDCFCGRFGDQKTIPLLINFDGKTVLQRTLKQSLSYSEVRFKVVVAYSKLFWSISSMYNSCVIG